jgi:hypothetical protein
MVSCTEQVSQITVYNGMYQYVLARNSMHTVQVYTRIIMNEYLWIEVMKAMLWHFEGVTSGSHNGPEQL